MKALHRVRLFARLYTAKMLLVSGPINNAEHVFIHVNSCNKSSLHETPGSIRIMLAIGTNGILCDWSKDVTVTS